jgi:hypothetical protein
VELDRILKVRAAALARFGENAIPVGTPMSQLEDTLVPLYLLHRYQTEAAAKEIGGMDYRYALRGDGEVVADIVPAAEQKKALAAVMKTLSPEALTLPEPLLRLLPPRALGYPRTRESFPAQTGLTFDPLAAAEAAADLSLKLLFDPDRASRLVEYSARDAANPSLEFVIGEVLQATWKAPRPAGLRGATQDVVDHAVLEELLGLAAGPGSASAVARAQALALRGWLKGVEGAQAAAAVARIDAFEKSPEKFVVGVAPAAPPGQPIGDVE